MALKSLYSESELLERIAVGDEQAFTLFYYQYNKTVYLFAYRILESEELAEELMQEVMLKIWMLGGELTKIANIESYLRVMCRNRCYNQLRTLRREAGRNEAATKDWSEGSNETEEAVLLNDTKGVLEKAIKDLPAQQREVYRLCHIEGMKYEEAARVLNISVLTVQSYMKLALRSLRATMRNHSDIAALLIIFKLL